MPRSLPGNGFLPMQKSHASRALAAACGVGVTVLLSGCGGGGASPIGAPPSRGPGIGGATGATAPNATAAFHVDVQTGKVSVTNLQGGGSGISKAFRGSAIGFETSTLLDQPGDVGRKVMKVVIANNTGEPLGNTPAGASNGINVLFSNFTNVSAFSELKSKTVVTAYAGSGTAGANEGAVNIAKFNKPGGMAIAPDGTLYVADSGNNRIRKISHGLVSTLAGSGTAGSTNGVGAAASFNNPQGIACDTYDNSLFVADSGNNKIRRVTLDGIVSTVAGTGAASSLNGYGDSATFNNPVGIVQGKYGSMLVTDDGNLIRQIEYQYSDRQDPQYYKVSTYAGTGAAGSTDGTTAVATFNKPRGLAYDDDADDLYVADSGSNKIRRVSATKQVITIAGTGTAGITDGQGNVATFRTPYGISIVKGGLMVSDNVGRTVRQLTLAEGGSSSNPFSWRVATLAGNGTAGTANGPGTTATFSFPQMLATDAGSNVYLADSTANQIRQIRPSTGHFPIGIATGAAGAEPVQLFNPTGVIPSSGYGVNTPYVTYVGTLPTGSKSYSIDWTFIVPKGVTAFEFAVTVEAGTDYGAPPEAGAGAGSPDVDVRTIAGGALGYVDGNPSEARFSNTSGIAVDTKGDIYIADTVNNAVRRIGADTTVRTLVSGIGTTDGTGDVARISQPRGIAVSADGDVVYVTDSKNNTIRRISYQGGDRLNAKNWFVSTIAGVAGTGGKTDGTGDVASFNLPYGLCLSPGGVLYVSEKTGNRVRRVQWRGGDEDLAKSWAVNTVAGDNAAVAGVAGTTDGTGAAARFNAPLGLTCDRAGNVYLADSGNNRIRRITQDGITTTVAGATAGYADATGVAALFKTPQDVAVDSSGYIYVADSLNQRIRRISPTGAVKTVAGIGTAGTTDGPGNVNQFSTPSSVEVDQMGTLYVTDYATGTVRMVQRVLTGLKR